MLLQPICNDLFRNMRLEPPNLRIFTIFLLHLIQPIESTIVLANPLMQLEVEPAQRGAILEFGLIIYVAGSKAIDLYSPFKASELAGLGLSSREKDPKGGIVISLKTIFRGKLTYMVLR